MTKLNFFSNHISHEESCAFSQNILLACCCCFFFYASNLTGKYKAIDFAYWIITYIAMCVKTTAFVQQNFVQ